MKIANLVAVLLIGSIGSLLLTDTAQSEVLPNNPSQSSFGKISSKPPVTFQVRQRQATDLINKLLKQQLIHAAEDNSPKFLKSFDELKIEPLTGQDTNEQGGYKYTIETKGGSVVLHTATPQRPKLKAYFGLIYSYTGSTQLQVFNSIICESKKPLHKQRPIKIADIPVSKDDLSCPTAYKKFIPVISPLKK